MKDEEIAEQYADNISGLELTCSLLSAKDKSHAYRLGRYDGFLAGLKAGRPQWHDLRKDKNDLPKDMENVLINAFDYGINTCYVAHRLNGKWKSNCSSETFVHVIAWCEIPTFDKE